MRRDLRDGPVGVGIAGAIAAGLAASGQANSLCNEVNTALSDISAITSWLQTAGINSDVLTEIAGIPGLDPVSVLQCGCDLEQGFDQLASDLGDCLCDLVSWIPGVNCNSCTPPPPIPANCSLPANCFIGSSDPACQANNVIPGCSTIEIGGVQNQICPGSEQDGPNGAFVTATTGNPTAQPRYIASVRNRWCRLGRRWPRRNRRVEARFPAAPRGYSPALARTGRIRPAPRAQFRFVSVTTPINLPRWATHPKNGVRSICLATVSLAKSPPKAASASPLAPTRAWHDVRRVVLRSQSGNGLRSVLQSRNAAGQRDLLGPGPIQ